MTQSINIASQILFSTVIHIIVFKSHFAYICIWGLPRILGSILKTIKFYMISIFHAISHL